MEFLLNHIILEVAIRRPRTCSYMFLYFKVTLVFVAFEYSLYKL